MNQHPEKFGNRPGCAALRLFCLLGLLLFMAAEGLLALESTKTSSGNNMNFTITPTSKIWFARPKSQWPKGSGHFYGGTTGSSGAGFVAGCARDLDGDGTYEDTAFTNIRHREMCGWLSTPSAGELLKALYDAGNMMSAVTRQTEYNRAHSSLLPEDLEDWPVEFCDADGEPVLKGDQTIVARISDTFNEELRAGVAPMGISMELAHYFLNFGKNRDIVYVDARFQNMSEFLQYNDTKSYRDVSPVDGVTWQGMIIGHGGAYAYAGERDDDIGYLSSKKLLVVYDTDGTESWGIDVALMGYRYLRMPEFKGQDIRVVECATGWSGGFGTDSPNQDAQDYSEDATPYRWHAHLQISPDQTGPYTPEHDGTIWGWPGVSYSESEEYWDNWRFVKRAADWAVTLGFFNDFEPRDSSSLGMAIMFALPASSPAVYDPDNPTTKTMDAQCVPLVDLSDFAQDAYSSGLITPMPPAVPTLTIIPGDRKVTITWDDVSITTPDPYWQILEDTGENPLGNYKKLDFAGFHLYRCFTGPGDPVHEELLETWNAPDVPFYYVDEWDKEIQQYRGDPRLKNGFRVWYALVPFDENNILDENGEIVGTMSLEAGKVWNNIIQDYYQVIPRSDASDFKPSSMLSYGYIPPEGTTATVVSAASVELSGDGSGKLTEAPKYLEPQVEITFVPVNNQRIQQDLTLYMACASVNALPAYWHECRWYARQSVMQLQDGSGNVLNEPATEVGVGIHDNAAVTDIDVVFQGALDSYGINYALEVTFKDLHSYVDQPTVHADLDAGGYTGATIYAPITTPCAPGYQVGMKPAIGAWMRAGEFKVTWKSVGDDLSVDVVDNTHGITIPFGLYPDDNGKNSWGFMPAGTYDSFWDEIGGGDRSVQMLDKIPAGNTDEFALWVNGLVWVFAPKEITDADGNVTGTEMTMPSSGTVMTVTNALGEWNGDQTVFTQWADAPWEGDKWEIKIQGMSQEPADADLSKIKVVPNPYIVSSPRDNSPSQRRIEFINLPSACTIRIYSLGGNLVQVLNHIGSSRFGWGDYHNRDRDPYPDQAWVDSGWDRNSGTEPWNLRNRFGATVASGLYFYHVTDQLGKTHTGRFYVVN